MAGEPVEFTELREGHGRRVATDDAAVEGFLAKSVVRWMAGGGLAAFIAATAFVVDLKSDVRQTNTEISTLKAKVEETTFTREDAANLLAALQLVRLEITYLRRDLDALERRR